MWVFINCLIENPTFDSQTKENMTLQSKSFGSKALLNEKFILQVGWGHIALSWFLCLVASNNCDSSVVYFLFAVVACMFGMCLD